MVSGRLRKHDRDQIALDMIEWAQKEDSLNLNGFCGMKLLAPSKISNWAKEDDFFRQAYEVTKGILGERRERLLGESKLHVKAYDLNACTYDHFLKENRMEMARFEALLKFAEDDNTPPELKQKVIELMELMQKNQSRNIEETKSKAETKS